MAGPFQMAAPGLAQKDGCWRAFVVVSTLLILAAVGCLIAILAMALA